MKKIGLAGIAAGAMFAAVIGFAGPAQADGNGYGFGGYGHGGYGFGGYGHGGYGYGNHDSYPWLDKLYPSVQVPHVDTSPHH